MSSPLRRPLQRDDLDIETTITRYRAAMVDLTVDTTVDTTTYPQGQTAPWTNRGHTVDASEETPGQTVDTTVDTPSAAPPWTSSGVSRYTPEGPGVAPTTPQYDPSEDLF